MENYINRIYFGSCVDLINNIPDKSIDLIVADPPYNLKKDFGNKSDSWDTKEEWVEWSKKWIDACLPKLKDNGSIFIYGIHNYLCYIQVYLYECNLIYRRQFIWYYENGFSGFKNSPSALYEPILWFSKSNEYTYHQIREPYKSTERLKNKIIKNGKVWTPNPEGKHGGDVWEIPVLAGKRFANEKVNHPTQKPIEICNKIIKHFSNEGDTILVPFCGSGSECVSAKLNNRKYVSFEINETYIEIANGRLKELDNLLF